jgi:DnaJ-class molecular chaperone
MERIMKKLLFILMIFLITSCTFRSYEVNFNYNVGNNSMANISEYEKYKEEVAKAEGEGQYIEIPKGSGNLTIYIQAEVPKHIETSAEGQMSIPFKMIP